MLKENEDGSKSNFFPHFSFFLDENDNKAVQVKKKKSLKDRIAEKEEKRKKELEEKKRKVGLLLKPFKHELENLTGYSRWCGLSPKLQKV